ncbi:MAG: FecR domain-containing protein [Flavitalea sp.]
MTPKLPDQRYLDLAKKWVDGNITDTELQEYIQWLKDLDPDATLEIHTDKASQKQLLFDKIRERLAAEGAELPGSPEPKQAMLIPRMLKVAAVVTGIFLTGYLTFITVGTQKQPTPSAATAKKLPPATDVQPGSNGAVLTLANGKVIVLDTASNGALDNNVMKQTGTIVFADEKNDGIVQYNTLTTPRARQQQLVLPDGSKIWLNAESSIKFPTRFAGNTRQVEISGEVYFEVAPDKAKPFVVNIGNSSVNVLGTHFNIMAYSSEAFLETTLLEGKVEFRNNDQQVELKPGQQSKLSAKGQIRLSNNVDIDLVMAWKNGFQAFSSTDLKTILRQAGRWYDVDVEYDGEIPPGITFTGEVPREVTLLQLLKALESKQLQFELDAPNKKLLVHYN